MFDVVNTALTADKTGGGTITVGYPTGRSKGDYTGSKGHVMYIAGNKLVAPTDFAVTFNANASSITL